MNHPDPKLHQLISFAKSGIRIAASIIGAAAIANPQAAILIVAIGYGIAEIVAVVEELV